MPHPDFFSFVSDMLVRYAKDQRVMSVAGTGMSSLGQYSYDFSRYQLCWGWGTWKRAWQLYDKDLKNYDSSSKIDYLSPFIAWYFSHVLSLVKRRIIRTWDYQWSYAHFIRSGLAIIPTGNLVTNVGFDSSATNTTHISQAAHMPLQELKLPLRHPVSVVENISLSRKIESRFYLHLVAVLGLIKYSLLAKVKGL